MPRCWTRSRNCSTAARASPSGVPIAPVTKNGMKGTPKYGSSAKAFDRDDTWVGSANGNTRYSGTNASSTVNEDDPVPDNPETCQSLAATQSARGTRNCAGAGGSPSASAIDD